MAASHEQETVGVDGDGTDGHLGPRRTVALESYGHASLNRWCINRLRAVKPDSSKKFFVERCPGRAMAYMPKHPCASHHAMSSPIIASPPPTSRAPSSTKMSSTTPRHEPSFSVSRRTDA